MNVFHVSGEVRKTFESLIGLVAGIRSWRATGILGLMLIAVSALPGTEVAAKTEGFGAKVLVIHAAPRRPFQRRHPLARSAPIGGQCMIAGGVRKGLGVQYCAPYPKLILNEFAKMKPLVAYPMPNGTFEYYINVQVTGPATFRAVACGGNVTELALIPINGGGLPQLQLASNGCKGRQVFQATGPWVIRLETKKKEKGVAIYAAVEYSPS